MDGSSERPHCGPNCRGLTWASNLPSAPVEGFFRDISVPISSSFLFQVFGVDASDPITKTQEVCCQSINGKGIADVDYTLVNSRQRLFYPPCCHGVERIALRRNVKKRFRGPPQIPPEDLSLLLGKRQPYRVFVSRDIVRKTNRHQS